MDLKKKIKHCISKAFDIFETYTNRDCIDDIRDLIVEDIENNGDTEFNKKVNEILMEIDMENKSYSMAVSDIEALVEGV